MDGLSRIPRLVLLAALAALGLKLCLAATTEGTNDVDSFVRFLRGYLGSGAALVYERESEFNHPPLVLRLLVALRWLANATGLSFGFWLRALSGAADLAALLLLARVLRGRLETPSARAGLLLVALAPTSILVSGFHGNTDPIVFGLLLASIALLGEPRRTLWAGVAFGLSLSVKVVPLAFLPALLLWLPDRGERARFALAAAGTFLLLALPIVVEEPMLVARKVLGYTSFYGGWGLALIAGALPEGWSWIDRGFERSGPWLLVLVLLGLSWWMNRAARRPEPLLQCGALAFALLALTGAFSPQYLAWLVPFTVLLPPGLALLHHAASGAYLFLLYDFWAGGLPWVRADADRVGDPGPWLLPAQVLCWLLIVVCAARLVRRARATGLSVGT